MRKYTNKLLELVDEGYYGPLDESARDLIAQLLMWMSEADVKEFWYANGYQALEDQNEED